MQQEPRPLGRSSDAWTPFRGNMAVAAGASVITNLMLPYSDSIAVQLSFYIP